AAPGGADAAIAAGLLPEAVEEAVPPPPAPAPTREELLERAKGDHWRAVPALRALRRAADDDIATDEELAVLYLEAAQHDDDAIREEAVAGLAASPSTAIDVLRVALADRVREIRILAAIGLRLRGEDGGVDVLRDAVDHPELGARALGALRR
ncbi:MAG TPA: hypothetical protein VEI02_10470, partial [Planctomycetota bacterium]|nr:hypothetical protein [Planctomycetota bacterium]